MIPRASHSRIWGGVKAIHNVRYECCSTLTPLLNSHSWTSMFNYLLFFAQIAFVSASLHLDLLTVTAEELLFHLEIGHISSVQLVQRYLTQIEAHNKNGLSLHAVIDVAPKTEVLDIAGQLDYERRMGKSRGSLHGIPILVKVCVELIPMAAASAFGFVTESLYTMRGGYRITSQHVQNWV